MQFLIQHWRGLLPLSISFWGIFIALLFIFAVAEPWLLAQFTEHPEQLLRVSILSLLVTRLLIFPWQVIGLIRSNDRYFLEHRNAIVKIGVQALVVLAIFYTLLHSIYFIQNVFILKRQLAAYTPQLEPLGYQFKWLQAGQQLKISGTLEIGITRETREFLAASPNKAAIRSIVLDSPGGHIYEGRGLAKIISEMKLNTYVSHECSSACTTVFLAGEKRYLGKHGKLGFHQYRVEVNATRPIFPFHDMAAEQQKDLNSFKARGIKDWFLSRIFEQAPGKMWFPSQDELIKAGVVHRQLVP